MNRSNYHTHTLYCDGKNSPRELVEQAVALGCPQIGFTGHSYTETGDAEPYCMTPEGTARYKAEIRALQEEYRGKIGILLGTERDYFSADITDDRDYDYIIGSVHYVYKDGQYLPVDENPEWQCRIVREHYEGDFYAFIEEYYRQVGNLREKTHCDIVGHFDLITKFNENNALFDTCHPRYIAASDAALQKLLHKGLTFEVNYGAVQKGYRTSPFPEARIIALLRQNGEKLLFSSDCHDKDCLLFGIENENTFVPPAKIFPQETCRQ